MVITNFLGSLVTDNLMSAALHRTSPLNLRSNKFEYQMFKTSNDPLVFNKLFRFDFRALDI